MDSNQPDLEAPKVNDNQPTTSPPIMDVQPSPATPSSSDDTPGSPPLQESNADKSLANNEPVIEDPLATEPINDVPAAPDPDKTNLDPEPPVSTDNTPNPAVTHAEHPQHHKGAPVVVIVIAVVVAIALAGVGVFAFLKDKKPAADKSANTEQSNQTTEPPVTADTIDQTTKEIDQTVDKMDDTKDFPDDELSDQKLGL